jgi:hypothetical protein
VRVKPLRVMRLLLPTTATQTKATTTTTTTTTNTTRSHGVLATDRLDGEHACTFDY